MKIDGNALPLGCGGWMEGLRHWGDVRASVLTADGVPEGLDAGAVPGPVTLPLKLRVEAGTQAVLTERASQVSAMLSPLRSHTLELPDREGAYYTVQLSSPIEWEPTVWEARRFVLEAAPTVIAASPYRKKAVSNWWESTGGTVQAQETHGAAPSHPKIQAWGGFVAGTTVTVTGPGGYRMSFVSHSSLTSVEHLSLDWDRQHYYIAGRPNQPHLATLMTTLERPYHKAGAWTVSLSQGTVSKVKITENTRWL